MIISTIMIIITINVTIASPGFRWFTCGFRGLGFRGLASKGFYTGSIKVVFYEKGVIRILSSGFKV